MIAASERLLTGWRPGQPINLIEERTKLTMNVRMKTLFALDAERNGYKLGRWLERWLVLGGSLGANLIPASIPGSPVRHLMRINEQLALNLPRSK